VDEVLYHVGDIAHDGIVRHIVDEQVLDASALFNHRRNSQEEQPREYGAYREDGTQDADDAEAQVAAVLEEFDQRKEDVGQQPRQEKGQQDVAQQSQQPDDGSHDDGTRDAADEAVESDLLRFHGCKDSK